MKWGKKKTKRKSEDAESLFCIIRSSTVSDHGNFSSFDNQKDTPQKKLESVYRIRDVRFLEDVECTKRMQDVCYLIPGSVEGLDIAKIGWDQRCYQRFTRNLDWLKPAIESTHATCPKPCSAPASSESPRRRVPKRSLEKSPFIFRLTIICFVTKRQ